MCGEVPSWGVKTMWEKRMGTGSTLAGFAKLPIPNPFKYFFKLRRTILS
jgi:hypothetical protein